MKREDLKHAQAAMRKRTKPNRKLRTMYRLGARINPEDLPKQSRVFIKQELTALLASRILSPEYQFVGLQLLAYLDGSLKDLPKMYRYKYDAPPVITKTELSSNIQDLMNTMNEELDLPPEANNA